MIARRKKHLNLRLPPRVEAYQKKDGTYTFRFKHWDGENIPLGSDIVEARRKGHLLNAGKPIIGSLAELIDRYFKSTWFTNLAERTQKDYRDHCKQILKVFGNASVGDIEPADLAKYLREERANAPVRANREIRGFLSSVYEYGIEIGIVKNNPCRQVRRNPEKPRTRKVESHEIAAIIEIAKNTGPSAVLIALIAEFCAIAGQRREDVLRLLMPRNGDEFIRIEPQKTKFNEAQTVIDLPITPGIKDIIDRAKALPREIRGLFLFCNRKGQPYTDSGFKTMWNKLQVKLAKQGGVRFTFHDLRAYYVTEAKAKGWNVKDTTGHKDEGTADRIYDRRRVRTAKPLE